MANNIQEVLPRLDGQIGQSAPVTTISTVAIQAGHSQIILVILRSSEWIRVCVEEMEPRMTDVGANLEQALQLRELHNQLIEKIAAKQQHINGLMTQADFTVSTQQFYEDVYEAMAQSLAEAWRGLNKQLADRGKLLDQSVAFYQNAKEFGERLDKAAVDFRDTAIPSNTQDVARALQKHNDDRKNILESSMHTMNRGRDLLDHLKRLIEDAPIADRKAGKASCFGIEKVLEDLLDRRRALEDQWAQRKRRLEQCVSLYDLDGEVNRISDWFRTKGEDYLRRKDVGNTQEETQKLLKEHEAFEDQARDIQASVDRLIRSAEQVAHSDPANTEQLRSQARAINTLCDDFMERLDGRRRLLQEALDFYNNAIIADNYLSQLKVQLEPNKLPKNPSDRDQRLADLSSAISDIADPVIHDGKVLISKLGPITLGSQGIKNNVDKIEKKSAEMQEQCAPGTYKSSLQVQFDDKYSTLIKWLVNVGDAYLMSNNDMGDQLQTAMDFLQGHERLREDMKEKNHQVEILLQLTPELVQSAGPTYGPELQTKADKLKKHWNHITVCLDNRIMVAVILVRFHKLAKQLTNAMDNMEDQLKTMTQQETGPLSESSVLHYQEKWNHLVELHVQLESTGKNFLNEVVKVVRNDSILDTKTSVITVERMMKNFGERRRYLTDIYLSWNQKATQTKDFKSEWEAFVKYARKVITWVMDTEQAFFPQLAGELGKSLEDARSLQNRLQEFEPTAKKVDDKIESCVRTAEVLGLKGDTQGEKEKLVDDLMKVHHRFQERLTEYQVLLKMTIAFFLDVKQLNKKMNEAESDFQHGALPTSFSEASIRLKKHDDQKDQLINLYDDAVKEGDGILIRVKQTDPVSAAKVNLSEPLKMIETRRDHYLVEWEKHRQKLLGCLDRKKLAVEKQEICKAIDRTQGELQSMKGQYGDTVESVTVIIEKFADWTSKRLLPLEDKVKNFVSSAYICLDHNPKDSAAINSDIDDVQQRWSHLNKGIADHRDKLGSALEFHKTYRQSLEWQNKPKELLVAVGRKVPQCKQPEDAKMLKEQVNIFLNKDVPPQHARLKKLNEMAVDLFSTVPTYVSTLNMETKQIVDELKDTNDGLDNLVDKLEKAEEAKRKQPVQEEPLMAALKELEEASPIITHPLFIDEPVTKEVMRPVHEGVDFAALGAPPAEKKEVFETLPYFTQVTKDVVVQEGKYAQMECVVKGEPEPDVFWEKDGVQVHESKEIQLEYGDDDSCTLMFPRAKTALTGTYVCKAVNTVGEATCAAQLKVLTQQEWARLHEPPGKVPRILYISPDRRVDEGKPVKMTAQVQGTPAPKVIWSRNGEPMDPKKFTFRKDGDMYSVLIDKAQPTDDGLYSCNASNSLGKVEKNTTLSVKPYEIKPAKPLPVKPVKQPMEIKPVKQAPVQAAPVRVPTPMKPPRFLSTPKDMTLNAGVPATLVMEVEADPMPNIVWSKDGRPVSPGFCKQLRDGNKYALAISETLPEDSGRYTCTATNPAGSAEKAINLFVKGAEIIPKEEPKVSSEQVNLDNIRAPTFTEVPDDQTVNEGTPVQLTVEVDAEPRPTVMWMKNREPLDPRETKMVQDGNKYSLVLDDTTPKDSGFYTCVASNAAGKTERATRLSVKPSKADPSFQPPPSTTPMQHPKFLHVPDDQIVDECTPASLTMQVQAYPPPTVTWNKDGRPVSPGFTKQLQDGNKYTLFISEALPEDSGTYTCVASNPVGRAKESVQLMVRAVIEPKEEQKVSTAKKSLDQMKPPKFLKVPSDQIVDEGMPLTLELQIQGEPTPTVTWAKDGMPITSDFFKLKRDGDHYSLFIDEALPEDAGLFTCTASNPAGIEEKSIQVRVRGSRISPLPERLVSSGAISLDKMKPPEFLQVPEDQTIYEGAPFTLLVQIRAEPPPTVTWSKDDKPVAKDFYKLHQLGDKYSLSISDVLPEDTGFYTCTASNPAGRAERTIKLTVRDAPEGSAPEFMTRLADQSIPECGQLQLECKVRGDPPPEIHWYKNGVCIDDHHDYHITRHRDGLCKLELAEVLPDDAGEFMCKAENENGVAEVKARLRVTDPMLRPCFTTDLDAVTATDGHPCTLRCVVTGRPTPNVTWYKDDKVIKSSPAQEIQYINNIATFKLKKSCVFDAGRYTCKAVNPAGEATTTAELIVEEPRPEPRTVIPPRITVSSAPDHGSDKAKVAIPVGQEIRLDARIAGQPRPEVTWYHNEKRVKETETVKTVVTEETYSLIIREAKPSHAGQYRLVALNEAGRHSYTYEVDVEQPLVPVTTQTTETILHSAPPKQPLVVERLQDVQAVEQFGEIRLQVVIHGDPQPNVTWYFNNNPVYESTRHEIRNIGDRHELVVREPVPTDTGMYCCEAVNVHGTVRTECYVTVEEKVSPVVVVPLKDVPAHEGDTVNLDVKVSGSPLPQVKWLKDGKTVTETSRVRFTREESTLGLLIIHIKPTDAGVYKAVIDNNVGKCISTATISVGPPRHIPDFTKPLTDMTAVDGESVQFTCEVTGVPFPEITWYKDGAVILPDSDFRMTQEEHVLTLTIREVFPDDAGMFSVKASNSEGDCTTVCRLHVLGGYSSNGSNSSRVVRSRRTTTTETTRQHIVRQNSSPSFVITRQETVSDTEPSRYATVTSRQSSVDSRVSSSSVRTQSLDRLHSRVHSGVKGGEYVVNVEIQF